MKNTFEHQIKCGVQHPLSTKEKEEIIVKLTDAGKELFKKIYLYRPVPKKIEGDYYYFDCSVQQVTQYFKRLGKDGIIISPNNTKFAMKYFYSKANKAYNEICFPKEK